MNYVVHCKHMIRDAIEKDPIEPVLKIYEELVAKMMEDMRISGDSLMLEDFPLIMPTGNFYLILCNTMHFFILRCLWTACPCLLYTEFTLSI